MGSSMMEEEGRTLLGRDRGREAGRFGSIVRGFWPLGWVAFGGPQAHVALLMQRFVGASAPRRWIGEVQFLELFALCQALPGPSSTQLVTALGAVRGGLLGGMLAFLLFQIPGFLVMGWLGSMFQGAKDVTDGSLQALFLAFFQRAAMGLVAAAFSQVLLAAYVITQKTCGSDKWKMAIAVTSTFITVLVPGKYAPLLYPTLIVVGGLIEWNRSRIRPSAHAPVSPNDDDDDAHDIPPVPISHRTGLVSLLLFASVTLITIFVAHISRTVHGQLLYIFESFWRVGSLVFGGGQVVLPFIYQEVVAKNWLPEEIFLYGFALVQVMPGPMFNLGTFVGAAMHGPPGAVVASLGIFVPGLLLVFGCLPMWNHLRHVQSAKTFLGGVNAAAAGLINAATYIFLKTSLPNAASFAIMMVAGALSIVWSVPPPLIIPLGGLVGWILQNLGIGTGS